MTRTMLSLIAAAAAALTLAAGSTTAAPAAARKLTGTVGPGFTITLKKGTTKVRRLPRGTYTFVIRDRSSNHNFDLKGPVRKRFTSVSFVGTKTVRLRLKPGKYTYVCDPHASAMRGSFRVV
jgi:plastocyanin